MKPAHGKSVHDVTSVVVAADVEATAAVAVAEAVVVVAEATAVAAEAVAEAANAKAGAAVADDPTRRSTPRFTLFASLFVSRRKERRSCFKDCRSDQDS